MARASKVELLESRGFCFDKAYFINAKFHMKLSKTYQPNQYQDDIYKLWEEAGVFQPSPTAADCFSVIAPPPNATGMLHMGHVLGTVITDAFVRYQRMNGKAALFLPGTDHAAIATNAIIEKQLAKEGKTKYDLGRENFVKQVEGFIDQSRGNIAEQFKSIGASMDWTRERYTLEPAMNNVVNKVFEKMYGDGLIYRGHRIVNWDVVLQTTVSDDELEYSDEKTIFYTFKYGPFEIGTARPETKFADKYVVVHPDDDRYKNYNHGDTFEAEWINGTVKATVIKDNAIDMEFGTGAMTITPWHDQTDFEIAERHNLDRQQIIELDGTLLPLAGEFAGRKIEEVREDIANKLEAKGLLVEKEENYKHRVARSDRGKGIVEPQIMEQWFIDVNKPAMEWKNQKMSLKEVMQDVVRSGDIEIVPKRFENIYFSWVDNLRDWCISRQIWFGHQIPAWTRDADGQKEVFVGATDPSNMELQPNSSPLDSSGWTRDPDNLDTWFSSALWPFSTLFDPELAKDSNSSLEDMMAQSPDFAKYHTTDFMLMGSDIIFFWGARMIMMGTYITGEVPFKTLYLNGMILDKDGKKMSKSRPETAIDPCETIEEYGVDALRLSMINGLSPGNNMRLFDDKIKGNRNFCNKLWNIARFIEDQLDESYVPFGNPEINTPVDAWIVQRLNTTISDVSEAISGYQFGRANDQLYSFVWSDLADWYIEASKASSNPHLLAYILDNILRLLHPLVPFVTEVIWQTLGWSEKPLALQEWPKEAAIDTASADKFDAIKQTIAEIRRVAAVVDFDGEGVACVNDGLIHDMSELIIQMSPASSVDKATVESGLPLISYEGAFLELPPAKVEQYKDSLTKQSEDITKQVKGLESRLNNKKYVANAPPELVSESKQQLAGLQSQHKTLAAQLELMS